MSFHCSSYLNPSLIFGRQHCMICFGRQHCMICFSRVVPLSCSHATSKPLLRGNFFLRDIDVRLSNRSSSDYLKRFLLIARDPVVMYGRLILIWRDSYAARRVHAFIITCICCKKGLIRVKRIYKKVGLSIKSRMRG